MRPRVPPSTSFQLLAKEVKLMQDTIFVGIDVSLKSNAVCVLNSQGKKLSSFSVHNDQEGSRALASRVCSCVSKVAVESEIKVGIEATSIYGLPLLYFLKQEPSIVKANPHFYILNPRQVNGFKKTYSDLPKTDPVDAFVIADCLRFGRKWRSSIFNLSCAIPPCRGGITLPIGQSYFAARKRLTWMIFMRRSKN